MPGNQVNRRSLNSRLTTIDDYTLHSTYYEFFETGTFTDATITVRGVTFKVHKLILSSKSDVFRAMFSTEMLEGRSSRVQIDDTDPEVFREFLFHVYNDSAPNMAQFPVQMMEIADKYGVPSIVEDSESFLKKNVDVTTAAEFLMAAHRFNRKYLKKKLLAFVRSKMAEIARTNDWLMARSQFDLMTELVLSFPDKSFGGKSNCIQTIQREMTSDVTLTWWIPSSVLEKEELSPYFNVVLQSKKFRFKFITTVTHHNGVIVKLVLEPNLDGLKFEADFMVSNKQKEYGFQTHETVSNSSSILFLLLKTDVEILMRQGPLSCSIKLPTTATQRLGEPSAADRLFEGFLTHRQFSDVRFKVGSTIFEAHRVVLATKSPFFNALFHDSNELYVINDVTEKAFDTLLQYCYSERFPAAELMNLELFECVKKFGFPKLLQAIGQRLVERLEPVDALQALIVAHRSGSVLLKRRALEIVGSNIRTIVQSPAWRRIAEYPELVTELLILLA